MKDQPKPLDKTLSIEEDPIVAPNCLDQSLMPEESDSVELRSQKLGTALGKAMFYYGSENSRTDLLQRIEKSDPISCASEIQNFVALISGEHVRVATPTDEHVRDISIVINALCEEPRRNHTKSDIKPKTANAELHPGLVSTYLKNFQSLNFQRDLLQDRA